MRICVINSVFPPFESRLFHREITALVQAGHQVTLIGPHNRSEDLVEGVRILGFAPLYPILLRPANWLQIVKRLVHVQADAYHFHDAELLPMGLMLTWLTRKPVVYDCFEHYPLAILTDERIPRWGRPAFSQVFGLLERKSVEQLAAVIVLAVYAEDDHRFDRARRRVVVRNLPRRAMFEELPEAPRKRQLIHIGDISESRRGVSILIDMLALMHNRDASLLLVGKTDSPQTRRRLDELIEAHQLADRVRFVSPVPYQTVKSYLAESAVGLIPLKAVQRWQFDVPQKAFEYMACRLPFVMSETGATRRFAEETGVGIVVEPQSAQAFAEAVDFLLDNPAQANRMAERGRRAFLEEYNWEKESRKLIELYDGLAEP